MRSRKTSFMIQPQWLLKQRFLRRSQIRTYGISRACAHLIYCHEFMSVHVLLARMLTTPTLLFQQPFRVFCLPAAVFHTLHTRSSLKQLPSGMCYLWRVYCRARLGVIFPRDHIMLG